MPTNPYFDKYADVPKLGDYVRTNYGQTGRVTEVHHWCPQDAAWLMGQADARMRDHRDSPWVSVLVHNGGSVVVPGALCEQVEPFDLVNDFAVVYFRDSETDDLDELRAAVAAIRDAWDGGDLAGAVNDAVALLPAAKTGAQA